MKQKYYVVWEGIEPGIYDSWTACQEQIKGYTHARYKSFGSRKEAEEAYSSPPLAEPSLSNSKSPNSKSPNSKLSDSKLPYDDNSLAVDAACSGNPGKMEYRGVHVASRQEVFHYGPIYGTNNIGEFLAIVHGLALMEQKGIKMPIYSDSVNAINWVKQKKCKTQLPRNAKSEALFQIIERAEAWLKAHRVTTPVIKWETAVWGEIPADFGRK
ncbi:MAG: ribonuclease H family protein [Prevotellaceae bacterium]|jgi:ribonuclease HI|nr:ribonuclease H family protein [Prevotellaceae bacterium]